MTVDCILALDAGTTRVTALLVDHDGSVQARGYRELTQYYPQPGWVEHDAMEIWHATLAAADEAIAAAPQCRAVAIGIANQRETTLFWDRRTGDPLHRAIVWQCRRSASICEELRAAGIEPEITAKTGLRLDPYFSGTKALWLLRHDESLRGRMAAGEVCFGTVDSWLAWQLSAAKEHVTDFTNASRTLAFDIHELDWDDGLLDVFGLSRASMPRVQPSGSSFGTTAAFGTIPAGLPIAALVGDQQAALVGQVCFEPGMTKATYGTGCFVLMATGETAISSRRGLLTTLAATTTPGQPNYALEGSVFIAGAAVQWCIDNLALVASAAEAEALAATVPDSGGVVFVPAFAGLGSPHWNADVRGAMLGLTGATRPAHIVRAALESLVFQTQDVLTVMAEEADLAIPELRVDGGAAANNALMQLQADLSGSSASRPSSIESTALGAAYLAGLTVGFWTDQAEIASLRHEEARFLPSTAVESSRVLYERWQSAVQGLLSANIVPGEADLRPW